MNCEETQTQDNADIDKKEFSSQVFQCVAYIIHKCPVLQELFLKWSTLTNKEKILVNYIAFYVLESDQIELYSPIMQGFNYWNNIQDIEGACGFRDNPLEFKFNLEDEKRIFQIIMVLDQIITNILLRPTMCKEIRRLRLQVTTENGDSTGQGDR